MADKTKIEWTDATWNIITGCSVLSPGCKDCYAMGLAGTRLKNHPSRVGLTMDTKAGPVWTGEVRFNEQWLDQPLRWTKPRRIFACAHGDLFHENVPVAWIDRVFAVAALAHWHVVQVLTKRSARMLAYMSDPETPRRVWDAASEMMDTLPALAAHGASWGGEAPWPLRNVWMGVSAEDQPRADERLSDLVETPAVVRFVSVEPMIGPVDLSRATSRLDRIHQVIVGGENGDRLMHPDWVRPVRDQCAGAGIAFFFKQWGTWLPVLAVQVPHGLLRAMTVTGRHVPVGTIPAYTDEDGWTAWIFEKVGKKAAGRLLDGVEHNGMPGR